MHARSRHGGFHGDTAVPEPHRILDRAFLAHPPGSGTTETSGPGAASAFPGSFVAGRDRVPQRLGTVSTQVEHPFSLHRGTRPVLGACSLELSRTRSRRTPRRPPAGVIGSGDGRRRGVHGEQGPSPGFWWWSLCPPARHRTPARCTCPPRTAPRVPEGC